MNENKRVFIYLGMRTINLPKRGAPTRPTVQFPSKHLLLHHDRCRRFYSRISLQIIGLYPFSVQCIPFFVLLWLILRTIEKFYYYRDVCAPSLLYFIYIKNMCYFSILCVVNSQYDVTKEINFYVYVVKRLFSWLDSNRNEKYFCIREFCKKNVFVY